MRLTIEACANELATKGDALIKALADEFRADNSELADRLADRLEKALPRKESVLKYPVLRDLHRQTASLYDAMLDRMLAEVGAVVDGAVVQPKVVIEKARQAPTPLKKAMEAAASLLAVPMYDHSQAIADKDAVAYEKVKAVLKEQGAVESDFENGGKFAGLSVNALIDLAKI